MSQSLIVFLFLGLAAVLLIGNILRPDLVALILMLALGLSGILTPQEAFSGFSRSAVIIMLSAFILAEGLRRSGITERIGQFIVRLFGGGESRLVFGVMVAASILSLFMNNIAAASLLFPSLSGISHRAKVSPSRLLMPLAFGTVLGGMATLLSTTNIIASGLLRDVGLRGFGLLDFFPIGFPLTIAGILFVVLLGRKFLPAQSPAEQVEKGVQSGEILLNTYQLSDRLLRGRVYPKGSLNGKTLEDSGLRQIHHLNVIAIHRGKLALPLEPKTRLRGNDVLLILARPEDTLPENLHELLEILPPGAWEREYLAIPDLTLIEAAVAPRSSLAGKTLRDVRFEQKYNARVLAIWRRGRSIRTRLASLPLEFGDGLLLQGTARSLNLLRTEQDLMLLAESTPSTQTSLREWLAALIMLITLALAVIFPTLIAEIMLSGAVCMVLVGALNMDQAYRAIEWRSLFLVAGMLPVGVALAKTGGAALLAEGIIQITQGSGSFVLLAGLILLAVLLTQIINGSTAVTVVAPIAIAAAQRISLDPRLITLAIAFAASMAFMSPLSHPVNIMVMGAGGYTFRDYARVGIPLTILLVIILLALLSVVIRF